MSTHSASRPSRPARPGFLLIVFERLRRSRVHDEPNVRAIDSHPECHGRDNHVRFFFEERILMPATLVVG